MAESLKVSMGIESNIKKKEKTEKDREEGKTVFFVITEN